MLFFVRVTLTEQKWIILPERQGPQQISQNNGENRRYTFVTVCILVEKCAAELREKVEKTDKTTLSLRSPRTRPSAFFAVDLG
jgi:hypothetical protein